MIQNRRITLPEREDMLRRLMSVLGTPHAVEKLYPIILEEAGREIAAVGIVMMLQQAIADYTMDMQLVEFALIDMKVEGFITALIDDGAVRDEALDVMRSVRAMNAIE